MNSKKGDSKDYSLKKVNPHITYQQNNTPKCGKDKLHFNASTFLRDSHVGMSFYHYEEDLYGPPRRDSDISIDDLGRGQ